MSNLRYPLRLCRRSNLGYFLEQKIIPSRKVASHLTPNLLFDWHRIIYTFVLAQ